MKTGKIIGGIVLVLVILIGLDFGFGYLGVFKTRTVGKAQQDAQREVFESTQSFVEGKRQEALKMYREWTSADIEDKPGLEKMAGHTFANVDEKIFEEPLKTWVHNCKYGVPNTTRSYTPKIGD